MHLGSIVFTGCTQKQSGAPGITWVPLCTLGFTWVHLGSLGLTWVHLGSLGFTWVYLGSLGFTWVHFGSSGLIWETWDRMGHIGTLMTSTHLDNFPISRDPIGSNNRVEM